MDDTIISLDKLEKKIRQEYGDGKRSLFSYKDLLEILKKEQPEAVIFRIAIYSKGNFDYTCKTKDINFCNENKIITPDLELRNIPETGYLTTIINKIPEKELKVKLLFIMVEAGQFLQVENKFNWFGKDFL